LAGSRWLAFQMATVAACSQRSSYHCLGRPSTNCLTKASALSRPGAIVIGFECMCSPISSVRVAPGAQGQDRAAHLGAWSMARLSAACRTPRRLSHAARFNGAGHTIRWRRQGCKAGRIDPREYRCYPNYGFASREGDIGSRAVKYQPALQARITV